MGHQQGEYRLTTIPVRITRTVHCGAHRRTTTVRATLAECGYHYSSAIQSRPVRQFVQYHSIGLSKKQQSSSPSSSKQQQQSTFRPASTKNNISNRHSLSTRNNNSLITAVHSSLNIANFRQSSSTSSNLVQIVNYGKHQTSDKNSNNCSQPSTLLHLMETIRARANDAPTTDQPVNVTPQTM
jgi:hypothetical protein